MRIEKNGDKLIVGWQEHKKLKEYCLLVNKILISKTRELKDQLAVTKGMVCPFSVRNYDQLKG